jgi:hypothetical protein
MIGSSAECQKGTICHPLLLTPEGIFAVAKPNKKELAKTHFFFAISDDPKHEPSVEEIQETVFKKLSGDIFPINAESALLTTGNTIFLYNANGETEKKDILVNVTLNQDTLLALQALVHDREIALVPAGLVVNGLLGQAEYANQKWPNGLIAKIGKTMAFDLEEKDFLPTRRLTRKDNRLEKSLIIHRLSMLAASLLQAASQSVLTGSTVLASRGENQLALQLLGIAGTIAASGSEEFIGMHDKEAFTANLRAVLNDIVAKHEVDQRDLVGNPSLDLWAQEILTDLSDAEMSAPQITQMGPTLLGVGLAFGLYREILPLVTFLGSMAISQTISRFAVSRLKNPTGKLLRDSLSNLAASGIDNLSVIGGALLTAATGSNLGLHLMAVGLGTSDVKETLEDVQKVTRGTEALHRFREVVNQLNTSLNTPIKRQRHGERISAEEQLGEIYRIKNNDGDTILRFQALDEVAKRDERCVLFRDFTVQANDAVFINRQTLVLHPGINLLSVNRGLTRILRVLAEELEHPHGSTLIRFPNRDINFHTQVDSNLLAYYDCGEIDHVKFKPNFGKDTKTENVVDFLKDSGMFSEKDIDRFKKGDPATREFRSRLTLAQAVWENKPVIILDDMFDQENKLSEKELIEAIDFIGKIANERQTIFLIGGDTHALKSNRLTIDGKAVSIIEYLKEKNMLRSYHFVHDQQILDED